ncbi:MAG: CBS domain-containing protein [Gammaproteobacteria bacterium]|nr:CBS domain-containing protein [Gammaproteobacteria bacterium]
MILQEVLIPTIIAHPGMMVGEVFQECIAKGVRGIPFRNKDGIITGRISIRHVFRQACVTKDMIDGAHLMGDHIDHIELQDIEKCKILGQPVELYLLENIPALSSNASVRKAIAIMEQFNSSYAFVIDNGDYKGTVTRFGIASLLLKYWDLGPTETRSGD